MIQRQFVDLIGKCIPKSNYILKITITNDYNKKHKISL